MTIPQQLSALLAEAFRKAGHDVPEDFSPSVESTADPKFGDYQSNAAMLMAKQLKTNPRAIAQSVVEAFDSPEDFESPEVAGPGFLNFKLTPAHVSKRAKVLLNDERFGVPQVVNPEKVIVDFSSPNVAKPMHIGHLRSTVIGDTLARIAEFVGHDVVRDNHIGDWGRPMGLVLYGWKNHLDEAAFEADAIAELLRIYKMMKGLADEDEAVKAACDEETVKLQDGDEENRALWQRFIELSCAALDENYERLGIRFDVTLGESHYHSALAPLIEKVLEEGVAVESQGEICVLSDGEVDQKEDPFLTHRDGEWESVGFKLRGRDGAFGYATTDLATIDARVEELKADQIWYVVDARQSLHFRQLFATAARHGVDAECHHIGFGTINGKDGKPFKTREGDLVSLAAVLAEAVERAGAVVAEKNPEMDEAGRSAIAEVLGIAAVRYSELCQARHKDYVFDWDKMLALKGNTAPYLLNAYVRTRSIFRRLGEEAQIDSEAIEVETAAERRLAMKLARFGEVVPTVLNDFRPNLLANYLFELAGEFHSFWEACPVLSAEGVSRNTRLALCETASGVLKSGLDLLGIRVTERM